jgi:pyroglutamyl-peptidase
MTIRVLATGFGPFPKVPVNPTELLMADLAADPPDLGPDATFATEVLPTEYHGLGERIAALGRAHAPNVAVHFGVSARDVAIRLERVARNRVATDRVDAAGALPPARAIAPGLRGRRTRLPLDAITAALRAEGLPVRLSDDAGAYLCNALFFRALVGLDPPYAATTTGFVHVPPHGEHLSRSELTRAARVILACAVTAERARRAR